MAGKYFTVEVKPTMTASLQHTTAMGGGDVLCDWTAFDIPKGGARLISVVAIVRGTDGTPQTARDLEIYFAKSSNGGSTAPPTIGTINATADGVGFANQIVGVAKLENTAGTDWKLHLDNFSVASTGHGAGPNQMSFGVLEGEPESGTNVGYDKLYLAILTAGALDFTSGMTVDGTPATSQANLDVEDVSALTMLSPGDVIHDEDDRLMGTVKTITDANNVLMEDNLANAGVNDKKLYVLNPIKLVLSFEK